MTITVGFKAEHTFAYARAREGHFGPFEEWLYTYLEGMRTLNLVQRALLKQLYLGLITQARGNAIFTEALRKHLEKLPGITDDPELHSFIRAQAF